MVVAREVLNLRLREILREEKGGTYGVGVSGGISREPIERFATGFGFTCEPSRARNLIAAALEEIKRLKIEGPSRVNLNKVKETHTKGYQKGLKENGYWLSQLSSTLKEERELTSILNKEDLFESVTPEAIRAAFESYFADENRLIAILYPEGFEEELK